MKKLGHDAELTFDMFQFMLPMREGSLAKCPLRKNGLPNPALPNVTEEDMESLLLNMKDERLASRYGAEPNSDCRSKA